MTTISPSPPPLTSPMRVPYAEMPRLMTLLTGDEKHWASATSTLDALWVLYDRMLLSKGHGPMAYYATLCARGFFDEDVLATFARYDSPLGGHPDRTLIPGVEISSGSLGHGLPLAVGMALGLRAKGNTTSRVYCLVGDAELDEGTNHEAIAAAARYGLDRLHEVVVDNQSASLGWPGGGIAARFQVEGWSAETVDGRDHVALERALTASDTGRPIATVAVVEKKS
jgi:transketolase